MYSSAMLTVFGAKSIVVKKERERDMDRMVDQRMIFVFVIQVLEEEKKKPLF